MSRSRKQNTTGAKSVSSQCKNNGSCPWCEGNRTFNSNPKTSIQSEVDYYAIDEQQDVYRTEYFTKEDITNAN